METDINSTNPSQQLPQTNQVPSQPIPEPGNNKLVKTILYIVGAVVFMVIGAFGMYFYQKGTLKEVTPTQTQIPSTSASPKVSSVKYETATKPNPQDSSKTDVYTINTQTGEEKFFITLTDVYTQHFHNSEYHNGNLYIIKRTGNDTYPSDAWMDELWKYDSTKNGQKLFSLKGLSFLVSSDESFIAITEGTNKLTFIDNSGSTIKEFSLNQLSNIQNDPREPRIGLSLWSSDSGTLWGSLGLGTATYEFFQVKTTGWLATKYDISNMLVGSDNALNADIGKLAYSDYPALLDVDTANQYKASGKKVTLFVYDFSTKSNKVVSTSVTKQFSPKWINTNTLEYDNPTGQGRLTYSAQ
ncbi:MAG: hypothetical protein NTZ07_03065 [Candidatus Woesebacteria bacterium]|nr:hypothetical protein [Candidatus Woesebacteria bacterium]